MKTQKLILLSLLLLLPLCGLSAKRALVVGISKYPQDKGELSWPIIHGANDVTIIKPILEKQGFAVTALINQKATATNIRKALATLVKKAQKSDIIYFHFSGHGQPVEDLSGDEVDGWDEAIIPYDALKRFKKGVYTGKKHILDDEIGVYVNALRRKIGPKGMVYVVLDACHMGSASRADDADDEAVFCRGTNVGFSKTSKPFVPKIDSRSNMRLTKKANWGNACFLEACRAYQSNYEAKFNGTYYGPLTYYVCRVLSKHSLSNGNTWVELVRRMMNADRRLSRQNMVVEKSY